MWIHSGLGAQVAELERLNTRRIEHRFALSRRVYCDAERVGQILSNLLHNALVHGDPGAPVQVAVASDAEAFEMAVTNAGKPIPSTQLAGLYQPFSRSAGQGMGLGLFICAELAKAHGGELQVESTEQKTCFRLRLPLPAT